MHKERQAMLTGVMSEVIEKKIERINGHRKEIELPPVNSAIGGEKKWSF
jgi:hypothetical protein